MKGVLVIVPCGYRKIWDREPNYGPVKAFKAYIGAPFKVNREYAERYAERWVILSAKYGFISPDFIIPGPYNVTFKKKDTDPVSISTLKEQILTQSLNIYEKVIGLGGKEYRSAVELAFSSENIFFPFSGLPIGKAMQATKQAINLSQLTF